MYDTRPAWWMANELGHRVGLEAFFDCDSIEDYLNRELRSVASSLDEMAALGGIIVQDGKPYFEDYDGAWL